MVGRNRTEIKRRKRKGRKMEIYIYREREWCRAYMRVDYMSHMVENVNFQIEYIFQSVFFMIHMLNCLSTTPRKHGGMDV